MPKHIRRRRTNSVENDQPLEEVLDRQLELLTRKFMELAQNENERFLAEHGEVAITAGAAAGAYALVDTGIRIFAGMISRLPPERREDYIDNLVARFEPTLRSRIAEAEAATILKGH